MERVLLILVLLGTAAGASWIDNNTYFIGTGSTYRFNDTYDMTGKLGYIHVNRIYINGTSLNVTADSGTCNVTILNITNNQTRWAEKCEEYSNVTMVIGNFSTNMTLEIEGVLNFTNLPSANGSMEITLYDFGNISIMFLLYPSVTTTVPATTTTISSGGGGDSGSAGELNLSTTMLDGYIIYPLDTRWESVITSTDTITTCTSSEGFACYVNSNVLTVVYTANDDIGDFYSRIRGNVIVSGSGKSENVSIRLDFYNIAAYYEFRPISQQMSFFPVGNSVMFHIDKSRIAGIRYITMLGILLGMVMTYRRYKTGGRNESKN